MQVAIPYAQGDWKKRLRGYLINEELFKKLYSNGVHLITKIRKNMNNKLVEMKDKLLLRKRGFVESVGNILKESISIEHSRHRSLAGFLCHVLVLLQPTVFAKKSLPLLRVLI